MFILPSDLLRPTPGLPETVVSPNWTATLGMLGARSLSLARKGGRRGASLHRAGYTDRVSDSATRRIVHVDMDAFYASVEQRDRPELRGRPVAVGGDAARRGVVCAASYEARAFGVRSAMSMARAERLCPSLVVVPPDFSKYRRVSQQVFEIFHSVTPLVEPLSLDEAYLDVTENLWNEPLATPVARRIKATIRTETGLTASAGVAPNKFLAKIASGWKKPDGLTVVPPSRVEPFLHQLDIDALWGVGPKTAARLRAHGLVRLVDVRKATDELLTTLVGKQAGWLRMLAMGVDPRTVQPNREAKSSSSEHTYDTDLVDAEQMRAEVERLASRQAQWLERRQLFARTVTLKVRFSDFSTITRNSTSESGLREVEEIVQRALELFQRTDAGQRAVRLLGVGVHNFSSMRTAAPGATRPLPLFDASEGQEGPGALDPTARTSETHG